MVKKHIVKRHGVKEIFDEKKIYGSVYAAAINAHYGEKQAETTAQNAMLAVKKWIRSKSEVSSDEIRFQVLQQIKDQDVALLYKHHLDIC